MSTNPKSIYNEFVRANLPFGITYDEVRAQYVTFNGKRFPTYLQAKWYVDYIDKLGVGALDALYNSLFGNDEQGVWYDPSDLDTLFQDTAGTTPVTTSGQTVGLMLDKSGNGNHATQPTAAARPTYQTDGTYHWLSFDGVDDFMVTPTITPGIDKAQVFAGVRKLSVSGEIIENNYSSGSGKFFVRASNFGGVGNQYSSASRGGTTPGITLTAQTSTDYAPPISNVIASINDISGDLTRLRIDGNAEIIDAIGNKGIGNFAENPVYIGARAGAALFFNGNIYSLVTRFGANLETSTIETTETYVAGKTGVDL